ncbi:MAG: flagellar basal body L-ring protein FlgH [Phycisphaeraceae bacterium]
MIDRMIWYLILVITGLFVVTAKGQTSSLYVADAQRDAAPAVVVNGQPNRLSPAIARTSLVAVPPLRLRQFAVNDLVTIIIREFTQADSTAELDTEKDVRFRGDISEFPNLNLRDLLNFQIQASANEDPPKLEMRFRPDFDGEGDYKRKDSLTGRITARIIDIKPNGNLVLEARKYIEQDDETLSLVLTGTCRSEDVTVDNTVLSTELYDLRLAKEHTGELRKVTRKGLLTKLLELIFNF